MGENLSLGYHLRVVAFQVRKLSPIPAYFVLAGGQALFFTTAVSFNLVFQTQEAGLSPFELVLIGTALQGTIFVCEVPTGVLADVYGRRLSIIIGLCLLGLGLMVNGSFPRFETILLGQFVWGCGSTFISGARQAWIADEIGPERAAKVYLRSAQVEQLSWLIAIPLSTLLATIDLNLPILLGGACLVGLAVVVALTMTERGFQRPERADGREAWRNLTDTFVAGTGLIRRSPLLVTVFCITAFYGMASQGFDRLWVAHFFRDIHFPTAGNLDPVLWFGVIRMGSAILTIAGVEFVRRRVDTASHAFVSRGLFWINAYQTVIVFVFALAGSFFIGMFAFWIAIALSFMYDPLYLAWINQNIESRVRATVISMTRQTDAIGRIAGGPVLGAIGSLVSLRAALIGAGVTLMPALLLYTRAFGQGKATLPEEGAPEAGPAASG